MMFDVTKLTNIKYQESAAMILTAPQNGVNASGMDRGDS